MYIFINLCVNNDSINHILKGKFIDLSHKIYATWILSGRYLPKFNQLKVQTNIYIIIILFLQYS